MAGRLRFVPLVVFGVVLLVVYSALNRPLLYDEYVYFALGGLPSTVSVLEAILSTTTNVNQGVTGAYMLADYWLLNTFGASSTALRLPSLLFAAALLAYGAIFLRSRGAGPWTLAALPVLLVTQELLMRYAGEARTYMPLAAAVIGLLAYYSLRGRSPNDSSLLTPVVGWSAAIIGVLFHPYIALYWPAIVAFSYFAFTPRRHSVRNFISFAHPALVITGSVIFLVIGLLTWMRGRANANVDPFNFLPGPLPVEVAAQNLYFLAESRFSLGMATALMLIWLGASLIARVSLGVLAKILIAPVGLIVLAFLLALAVSFISIRADFWIFPRQWIASVALVVIAVLWGFSAWFGYLKQSLGKGSLRVMMTVTALLLIGMAVPSVTSQWQLLQDWQQRTLVTEQTQQQLAQRLETETILSDPEWIEFAQANIDQGGSVWPEFGRYYTDTDWSAFVLVD
jgi:hypothetical protein